MSATLPHKLLFLDIDGVLNDHIRLPNGYSPILPSRVTELNRILQAVPECLIVLSSAWRYAFTTDRAIENLLGCHGCDCNGRIHGLTESDEATHADREAWHRLGMEWRPKQILGYVATHKPAAYVVLDDLPLAVPNLVQTDPTMGLCRGHALRAISILMGEANEAVKA